MSEQTTSGQPAACPTGAVRVTMYDVGFGDCFLLSVPYADGTERHVLIDCGSSSKRADHMARVARAVAQDCGGRLAAVVSTHRHSDHLSAFGLKQAGDILAGLDPEVVIQPWTEHPDAAEDAHQAPSTFTLAHLHSLDLGQAFAATLGRQTRATLPGASARTVKHVTDLAKLNIHNKKAVARLQEMGRRHAWVHAGGPSGLEEALPGVTVTVLGPPTLEQCAAMRTQARWDEAEFWELQGQPATPARAPALFPDAATISRDEAPSYVRWVVGKLDALHAADALRIVTALNRALNNTSVMLLFEVDEKALLFPGDAQLESWQHVLSQDELRDRLARVRLYKVGHHGSTSATPRSLWALFDRRGDETRPDRLITLLSTQTGEHHRVPRPSLVAALQAGSELHDTQRWCDELGRSWTL